MIDMAQDRVTERRDLLKTVAEHHALTFGALATVEQHGLIAVGDECSWISANELSESDLSRPYNLCVGPEAGGAAEPGYRDSMMPGQGV
jgi:hypothetical protein